MKYYKKINNEFLGFYDSKINESQLFDIKYDRKSDLPIKVLKDNFYEISEEKWLELLDGNSEGKEIRILKDGNIGLYTFPEKRIEGANVVFDYDKEIWIDVATTQEKQDFWKKKMIETNNQIKELQEIGLGGGSEESSLRAKLEEYRKQYMNAVQEEAIEIDRGMA